MRGWSFAFENPYEGVVWLSFVGLSFSYPILLSRGSLVAWNWEFPTETKVLDTSLHRCRFAHFRQMMLREMNLWHYPNNISWILFLKASSIAFPNIVGIFLKNFSHNSRLMNNLVVLQDRSLYVFMY